MVNRFALFSTSFFFFVYSAFVSGYLLSTSVGLAFSLFIFLDFVNKLGTELPIKEFILLLASFQWIVGAKISYNLGKQHYKYYMYVDENEYMGYVVPAVLLFYLGFSFLPQKLQIADLRKTMEKYKERLLPGGVSLVVIGVLSAIISRFYQGSFSFIFFLSELLLYIGLGYLLLIFKQYKYLIFSLTLGIIFILSVNQGSFHKLLLVGSFLSFFTISHKFKFVKKLLLIVVVVSGVFVIQTVKSDLREIVWRSNTGQNPLDVFWDLVKKEFVVQQSDYLYLSDKNETLKDQADLNVRLNQGWIISKVLENVPKNIPFQNGRTIVEAFEASLLPRFLFPDKIGATHGLENFRQITGLALNNKTSMGLSIAAEFYANFGIIGGWIAILVYGIFLAFTIRLLVNNLGHNSPLIFLWFILVFFQVVKAETELMKIINHITKSIVFFMIFNFITNQFGVQLFLKDRDGES